MNSSYDHMKSIQLQFFHESDIIILEAEDVSKQI